MEYQPPDDIEPSEKSVDDGPADALPRHPRQDYRDDGTDTEAG